MKVKIVFNDDSWIIGHSLSFWDILRSRITETHGTHHWWVEDMSGEFVGIAREVIGYRVAVPINSMKFMVIL